MKMARRPGVLRMISPPRAFSAGYGSFGDGAGWAGPSLIMRYLRTSKLNVRNRSGGSCPRRLVKPRGKPPADIVKKLACRRNKSWEIQFAHSSCSFPGRDNARLTALVSRAGTVTSKERHSRVPWDGTLFSLAGSAVVPTARGMFALSGKNRMPEGR